MQAFLSKDAKTTGQGLKVDSYNTQTQPIGPGQRRLLHELTVSVLWPHRDHDLDLFLSLGKGYLATDEIGRPVGSAMYFAMGDDFAMLGMMVTAPRLQAQGAGRWLLQSIMRDCAGRDLRLSATLSGYRLYEAAGFTPVGIIRQQQGIARTPAAPAAPPGLEIRPLGRGDEPALRDLDTAAYGAERTHAFDLLLPLSTGTAALRGGVLRGFALTRRFGRGAVIGPVVAEDDDMAMQLVAPLIRPGTFMRLDTPVDSERFVGFLTAAGMVAFDTVTEMRIGPHRRAVSGSITYGLTSQTLG
ncbi:GNAT family N-acetyltransferase [Cereibacter sp. SYSU M97828]|nr:GNAT family N-acetyltransferase [Cereibacter flavus]